MNDRKLVFRCCKGLSMATYFVGPVQAQFTEFVLRVTRHTTTSASAVLNEGKPDTMDAGKPAN